MKVKENKLKLDLSYYNTNEEVSWIVIKDKENKNLAEVKGPYSGTSNEKAMETAKVFLKAFEMKELLEELTELNKITLTLNPSISKLYKRAKNLLNDI